MCVCTVQWYRLLIDRVMSVSDFTQEETWLKYRMNHVTIDPYGDIHNRSNESRVCREKMKIAHSPP